MAEWYEETYYPHWRQRFLVERYVHRGRTAFQEAIVFESPQVGRVLVLDGFVQTTERDEFIYHEMITHVALMAHGAAREVLIIGGGDGGALEEVLKHQTVARVTMVELDPGVVELARRHLPGISRGAFDDPRTRLIFGDGVKFVAGTEQQFDVIIVNSTDLVGPGAVLFTEVVLCRLPRAAARRRHPHRAERQPLCGARAGARLPGAPRQSVPGYEPHFDCGAHLSRRPVRVRLGL